MLTRLPALCAIAIGAGCAHGGAALLPPEQVEAAYLEAHGAHPACSQDDQRCCAEKVAAARAALPAAALRLWDDVALACPARRPEAAAATLAAPLAPPNHTYRIRLSPAFRLYWVSAAASGGGRSVEVEIEAIRFSGGRPGPLLAVTHRLDVAASPDGPLVIEVTEAPPGSPSPLAIAAHREPVPAPRARPASAAPPRPSPPPRLEKARPLHLPPLRAPLELGPLPPATTPPLRLCLDRDGQLDTVRFLGPAHPRVAASIIDRYRDGRFEPYRVNDVAVPSCQVLAAAAAPAP
jgi:hypothetical protein